MTHLWRFYGFFGDVRVTFGVTVKTRNIALIGLYAALLCISAWIRVPFGPIVLTFQVAVVALIAMTLRPLPAFLSMATYLVLGLAGLPVFATGGGLGYVLHPTFGYLIGMVLGAPLGAWYLRSREMNFKNAFIAGIAGIIASYVCGVGYMWALGQFVLGTGTTFAAIMSVALGILYIKDVVLVALIATIAPKLKNHIASST